MFLLYDIDYSLCLAIAGIVAAAHGQFSLYFTVVHPFLPQNYTSPLHGSGPSHTESVRAHSLKPDLPYLKDEVFFLASFSQGGTKKAATLPQAGSMEKILADADSQVKHSDSSHSGMLVEGRHQWPEICPTSNSAPQRRGDSESATFLSSNAFSALMLLVGCQEVHLAYKS